MDDSVFSLELENSDDVILEIPDVDAAVISDVVAETFEIDDISDLDLSVSGEVESIDLDGDVGSDTLSDALLIRTEESIVESLTSFASGVRDALAVYKGHMAKGSDLPEFVIPYDDFRFMPENVFKVFCSILLDLVGVTSSSQECNTVDESLADRSTQLLFEATGWSPELVKPEYIEKFIKHATKINRIRSTLNPTEEINDIVSLMDVNRMRLASRVFEVNTRSFMMIHSFFNDSAAMASTSLVDHAVLGVFIEDYMSRHGLNNLSVRDVYKAVGEYLSGRDSMEALHLTQDEILEYSTGELLRRTLLYELNSGVLYPGSLRGVPLTVEKGVPATILFLMDAIKGGSIVASMLFAIGSSMNALKEWNEKIEDFLIGLLVYFQAFLEDATLVNPVYYGQIRKTDGGTVLSYAVGDRTFDIKSDGFLCDVIGDKSGTRCIPYVLLDEKHGYAVCPPPSLYRQLHSVVRSGRTRVSGSMCYRFTPTVSWLAANKVLVDDSGSSDTLHSTLQSGSSSLLQILLSYDNEFEDDGRAVTPMVVKCRDYTYYAVAVGSIQDTVRVCAVSDGSGIIANDGVLYRDPETGMLISSFTSMSQEFIERQHTPGEYQEEYLGTPDDQDSVAWAFDDFVFTAKTAKPLDISGYMSAVMRLCSVNALDYQEEIEWAMDIVAREFFYVVKVHAIDTLVASRVLSVYRKYAESRISVGEQTGVDSFNFPSLKELFDIIYGKPNQLSSIDSWSQECSELLAESSGVTVDSICAQLDDLDFNMLALWSVNPSELRRTPRIDMLYALHAIPEIGTRLQLLENKLVVMHVMKLIGYSCYDIFSSKNILVTTYDSPLDEAIVDYSSDVLLGKLKKKKELDHALPLCKKVLTSTPASDSGSLKYYVLERNLYGLLADLQTSDSEYAKCVPDFLKSLGLDPSFSVAGCTQQEFNSLVSQDDIVRCCGAMRSELLSMLYDGLIAESTNSDSFQAVKAYDMFNSFYDILLPGADKVEYCDYTNQFLKYAGSMLVSYVPVTGESADELDGGEVDRAMSFVKAPEDFYYDSDIGYLRSEPLEDTRVFHVD